MKEAYRKLPRERKLILYQVYIWRRQPALAVRNLPAVSVLFDWENLRKGTLQKRQLADLWSKIIHLADLH